ncbi:DUF1642 domain-containing protein [Streptococcus suis]
MNKKYKIGDEVLVRGTVNSEVRNGGIHVLHDGIDAFYMLDQIHEPQMVVVPRFVAEWIEESKRIYNLYGLIGRIKDKLAPPEIMKWFYTNPTSTGEILTRAWLDGFEIEQEKLYTVEIPNPNIPVQYHSRLTKNYKGKVVLEVQDWLNIAETYKLTESEIKQDFEWAWRWAKPVEVE